MTIHLVCFGIAKDITGHRQQSLEVPDGLTVGELKKLLLKKYPAFQHLRSLAIAVKAAYQADSYLIEDGEEVVIIPPVSGG